MRDLLIFTLFIVSLIAFGIATSGYLDPWTPKKKKRIYGVVIIASLVFVVSIPVLTTTSNRKKSALVEDKMYIPSGYIYVWDAKTTEESLQRQEARYYLIVRKDDGRIVEERVDSATYVKTDVGERILVD
jgi:hypothetical protein|nr:MAG TPA: Protein of unknown function (DUF2500) [Crassvirales sp.]